MQSDIALAQFLKLLSIKKLNINHLTITTMMKKYFAILATLFFTLSACADHEYAVSYSQLPAEAQNFVKTYFNIDDIAHIEMERDGLFHEYTVYLKNATTIDFDHTGKLESIDCERSPIPEGIMLSAITAYLNQYYPNLFAEKYTIDKRHIEVELNNDMELIFDLNGKFIRMDN